MSTPQNETIDVDVDDPPAHNLPAVIDPQKSINPYQGIGQVPITAEQAAQLESPIDPEQLDILPTGEVYMSQVWYRRKLNKVFGAGHWGMFPLGAYSQQDATLMREYALIVNGAFVADAVGEADYHPNNDRMSYATAATALKSNALSRLCKDLGIASECWDKRFTEKWIDQYALSVWRRDAKKRAPQWRRKDVKPFYDETGPAGPQQPQQAPAPRATAQPTPRAAEPAQRTQEAPKGPLPAENRPPAFTTRHGVVAGEHYQMGVFDIQFKEGNTNGRAWTRFDIIFGDGGQDSVMASTFDQKFADLAVDIKNENGQAEFVLKAPPRGNGWNLAELYWAPTAPVGQDAMPGIMEPMSAEEQDLTF